MFSFLNPFAYLKTFKQANDDINSSIEAAKPILDDFEELQENVQSLKRITAKMQTQLELLYTSVYKDNIEEYDKWVDYVIEIIKKKLPQEDLDMTEIVNALGKAPFNPGHLLHEQKETE